MNYMKCLGYSANTISGDKSAQCQRCARLSTFIAGERFIETPPPITVSFCKKYVRK